MVNLNVTNMSNKTNIISSLKKLKRRLSLPLIPTSAKTKSNFSEAHLNRQIKSMTSLHSDTVNSAKRLSVALEEIEIFEKEFLQPLDIAINEDENNNL